MTKLTLLLIFLSFIQAIAVDSYAQMTRLSLKIDAQPLEKVLEEIEAESEFFFLYNRDLIDVEQKVSVDAQNETIKAILDEVLDGKNIAYTVYDRQIVLSDVDVINKMVAQQKSVLGKVTDSSGSPLPGVTVVVKGTTQGTITDADGKYTLTNIPDDATLLFSFVGMRTQEIVVSGKTSINVVMIEEAIGIEEVVAVGYGTQKKANLTGAVGVAKAEVLENRPIANLGEGLQGIIPNLNITVRNGDPASSPSFNIRGFTSINGGEPLILVDNVPMDINRINPNDIESVSVLKDAAAGAIFGARAAFGVILVETKKATKGKMNITLNTQMSLAKPILNVDPMKNPYEYVTIWNKAAERTNGSILYNDAYVQGTKKWVENPTDENAWGVNDGEIQFYGNNNYRDKLVTDLAPAQQHDLSIYGGSENTTYYTSIGYFNKHGYLRQNNSKFERFNIFSKVNYKVNDWLELNEKIAFNSQNNDQPTEYGWDVGVNSIARAGTVMPIQFPDLPNYVEEGDHEKYEPYIGKYFVGKNFFPYLMDGGRETFTNNDLWLTTGAIITPIKGLKIVSNFSYQIFNRIFQSVHSKVEMVSTDLLSSDMIEYDKSDPDYIQNRNLNTHSYVFNTYGEYNISFLTDHHVTATIGYNQEWVHNQSLDGTAYSLITPSVANIHATTGSKQVDGGASHVALRGVFYRMNYNYKEKYLLEANGRYDGTSRFPKNGRFGFFPSFSVAWRISNENFLAGTKNWMDNLKIRASYGELGNQLLGDNYYPYISTMNSGIPETYPLILSGTTPELNIMWPNLVSPTLTWEKVISKNIGMDITLMNSKLDMSVDVYARDTKNMLMSKTYPSILGAEAPKENAANLRTNGWELSLTWRDKIKSDFHYNITLSLSDWESKITKYENLSGNINDYYVGKKIGEIWGFETVGISQYQEDIDNAPDQSQIGNNWRTGDIQYADLDDDNKITKGSLTLKDHGDLKIIGNSNPRYQFGLNFNLSYKNWGLTTFFQGIGKRDVWPSTNSWTWFYPFKTNYLESSAIADSWSEDNRNAYFPAPSLAYDSGEGKNYQVQSRFLQEGAYVRLKNITLSYDLPMNLLERIKVGGIQVYLSGMNLWEYSKIRRPLDPESIPEVTAGTVGGIEFPMQRLYTIGAKISF